MYVKFLEFEFEDFFISRLSIKILEDQAFLGPRYLTTVLQSIQLRMLNYQVE